MDFVLTVSLIRIVFKSIKQIEKYDVNFETTQNNSERKASPKFIQSYYVSILDLCSVVVRFIHSEKLLQIIRGNISLNSHHLHIMVKS